ncbi:energy-coupling factor transporter transmembrane component T [Paenibacillus sp.]|jgi:energy-coupling factor transport system permease protein|uniref:energy-coupling factor transporter transmembrane component T family protein n=1 Tax=Paenibacillus sp. TaxID=58172 RepID=UPI00282944A7|nr:energy-coupling factor transporter transmembrane component T [Paenibacillus sp.]MDR0269197.1 energy-coupling factor transporter transmembrane protein EcfT [Paenibacillus sp.]
MREKLLIGRLIDTGSPVHQLDPRAKLTAMLLYAVMVVAARTWPALLCLTAFSVLIMVLTRIPIGTYLKAAKPLRFLMLFILIVQCLAVKGGSVLITIGSWHLDMAGLQAGLYAVARMALLVSFTALLTFTTSPGQLNQGLEGMLKPFERIGISAERLSLMTGIALRFIPAILDEAQTILKAQASRGADLRELPWKDKGRMLMSLLVPVTVGAFRRAEDLTASMESRGYRIGAPRSRYRPLIWSMADTWFVGAFAIMCLTMIWIGIY